MLSFTCRATRQLAPLYPLYYSLAMYDVEYALLARTLYHLNSHMGGSMARNLVAASTVAHSFVPTGLT